MVHDAGSCSSVAAITMPETWVLVRVDRRPLPAGRPWPSRLRAGASRPSVSTSESSTSSTAGVGGRSMPSRRLRSSASLRPRWAETHWPPAPSPRRRTCGSQVGPRQASSRPGSQKTPIVRSAGPAWTAAWQTRLRATASAPSRSPTMPTTPAVGQVDLDGRGEHPGVGHDLLAPSSSSRGAGLGVERRAATDVADAGVEGEEVRRRRGGAATAGWSGSAARRSTRGGVGHLVAAPGPLGGGRLVEVVAEASPAPSRTARPPPRCRPCGAASAPTRCRRRDRAHQRDQRRIRGPIITTITTAASSSGADDGGHAEPGRRRRVLVRRRCDGRPAAADGPGRGGRLNGAVPAVVTLCRRARSRRE